MDDAAKEYLTDWRASILSDSYFRSVGENGPRRGATCEIRVRPTLPDAIVIRDTFYMSLSSHSEEILDFRTDERDVIARQRLIGRQSKDARAQMLRDGKLAAARA